MGYRRATARLAGPVRAGNLSVPPPPPLDVPPHDPESAELRQVERELGDRYTIVRTLGRGAFGAVYLGREKQLHRLVAIKVLHAERAWSEDERARMLREARTVANLSHPAIVPLLAFGETATSVHMVMPYVAGETLANVLRTTERLDPTEARRILIEVADALAYAHGEGVLHRDIKPENILLERAGAVGDDVPPRVRLIDFGVAAFPGRDQGIGATYETWGTPHFMAPEQAFGEPQLDPRSELYAVGVLGFLMLGGRLPFESTSPTERLRQQEKGPGIPLASCAPDAPPDLIVAIERCLAFEPEARWHSARELRDGLIAGAVGAAGARPSFAVVRQRLRSRRRRPAVPRQPGTPAGPELSAMFSGIGADVRYALRTLAKTPGFTAAVILTLAIGLGATTVMFSAVEGLVLRPLPVPDPNSLVVVQEEREGPNRTSAFGVSLFRYNRYLAYREAAEGVLTGLAAQSLEKFSVRLGDRARTADGLITSGNYFELLGIRPALGRFYTAAEDRPGSAEPVVVIGYDFWQRMLGGSNDALGRTLFVDSRPLTVIGVAPRGFNGALAGVFAADLWLPATTYRRPPPTLATPRDSTPPSTLVHVFGRLRAGVDVQGASAALDVTGRRIAPEDPRTRITGVRVEPLRALPGELRDPAARFLGMLLVVAGAVLLIAATNAAGMLLARAAARRREVATRLAVGATRTRLARQLLVESLVLCIAAGLAGLLIAFWLVRLLESWRTPFPMQLAVDLGLNPTVLAIAAATVLGAGLFAGLAPAIQGSAVDLSTAMKQGGVHEARRSTRLRAAFVVIQVALSVVLLAVAGLFVRSLRQTLAVDPGFVAEGVFHAGFSLGPHGYDAARGRQLADRLIERLRARPEVAGAALASSAPLSGTVNTWGVRRLDRPGDESVSTVWSAVDPGFIELLGVRLLAGRAISSTDAQNGPLIAVVNETLVQRLWPGDAPQQVIGRQFHGFDGPVTVVGVIANGKYTSLQEAERTFGFIPLAQRSFGYVRLYVRARGEASGAVDAVRAELAALDPNVALGDPTLLSADIDRYLVPQRLGSSLVGAFGLIGVLLAAMGLYGVLAYSVAQRVREFGIRIALGARGADIVRLVLRRGLQLVAVGIALGIIGAVVAGRLVEGFLFGASPADPLVLAAVPVILIAAALVASFIPARRAATADPMSSLRAE